MIGEKPESEIIKYLSNKKTNFVLLFGKNSVGKTCITASIIHYLNTECKYGKLSRENGSGDSSQWNDLRLKFLSKRLPSRTTGTAVYEIESVFVPDKSRRYLNSLSLTFLDIGGDELKKVHYNEDGKLPPHIDVFFKVKDISITFILVTSHAEAEEDDQLMVSFLEHLNSKSPRFHEAKLLLLISKWDSYTGRITNITDFLRQKMPLTFERLSHGTNNYSVFSIGEIVEDAHEPILLKYDSRSAKNVFGWIYNVLTGQKLA